MAGESLKSLRSDCTEIILPTEGCALKTLCCLRVVHTLGKGCLTGMQVYTSLCRDRKSSSVAAGHSIYPCTLILRHLPHGTAQTTCCPHTLLIGGPGRHSMQRLQVCTAQLLIATPQPYLIPPDSRKRVCSCGRSWSYGLAQLRVPGAKKRDTHPVIGRAGESSSAPGAPCPAEKG